MHTDSHAANLVRWSPNAPGAYESHFVKVNLPEDHLALWWRFTILHPLGTPVFDVWAIVFDTRDPDRSFAVKVPFTPEQVHIDRESLDTRYGNNTLQHGASSGSVSSDTHSFEWDVTWTTPDDAFRHFPFAAMYTGSMPRTKVLTPVMDGRFSGTVVVDGRRVSFSGARGMQGHNWGARHADSWVWVHCNAFAEDESAAFEAISSRIRVAGLKTPPLTVLHFQSATDSITLNGPADLVAARVGLETPGDTDDRLVWRFRNSAGGRCLEGHVGTSRTRFVGLTYPNPDASSVTCLNTKIADLELRVLTKRSVWRLDRTLTASGLAALEIGLQGDPHGVRIHT